MFDPDADGFVYYTLCARPGDLEAAVKTLAATGLGLTGRYSAGWPDVEASRAVAAERERSERANRVLLDEIARLRAAQPSVT
jgi:hypothetical protein